MSNEVGRNPPTSFFKKEVKELKEAFGKTKVCPKCKKRKDIESKFGYRRPTPTSLPIAQSYCKECR